MKMQEKKSQCFQNNMYRLDFFKIYFYSFIRDLFIYYIYQIC